MEHRDAITVLQRLLVVSSESRAAFLEAANAARSPGLASLFMRRAEHQEKIIEHLSEYLKRGSRKDDVPVPVAHRCSTFTLPAAITRPSHDQEDLLRACIRILDTAILEFARAYAPTLSLAQRISLERHHDQMRWSREELASLRRRHEPSKTRIRKAPRQDAKAGYGDDLWFGTLESPQHREN